MKIKIEIGQDKGFIYSSQKIRDEVFLKEQNIPTCFTAITEEME